MTPNPMSQLSGLIPIIEKIAADKATQIVQEALNKSQYSIPRVPDHYHNGTDSTMLEPSSINGFEALPSNVASTVDLSGVVSSKALGNQFVGQGSQTVGYGNFSAGNYTHKYGTFTSFPVPIIYGTGVGVDSDFNGGQAVQGTMVYFNNPGLFSSLYIKLVDGTWGEIKSA